jgi:hypothetical protein
MRRSSKVCSFYYFLSLRHRIQPSSPFLILMSVTFSLYFEPISLGYKLLSFTDSATLIFFRFWLRLLLSKFQMFIDLAVF